MRDYTLGDVVKYLLHVSGGKVEGVKKLMKLLFLVQYEKKLFGGIKKYEYGGKPITRTEFYIWSYGPFTNDVYDVLDELEVDDSEIPVIIKLPPNVDIREVERRLPKEVKERIREVVEKYGRKKGYELEKESLKMLKLDQFKKEEYKGLPIDEYLEKEGIKVEEEELEKVKLSHVF